MLVSRFACEARTLPDPSITWSTLASEAGLYGGERWYRLQSLDPVYEVGALVARDRGGCLAGALTTWAPRINGLDAYGRGLLSMSSRPLAPRDVVYVGSVGGFRAAPNVRADLDDTDRAAVEAALMSAAIRYAEDRGRVAVVPYAMAESPPSGFRRHPLTVEASIDLPGDFDEWLRGLSRNRRTSVRRERRDVAESGYRIEVRSLTDVLPRCVELLAQTQAKYGRVAQAKVLHRHLVRLHEVYGDDAVVFVAARSRGVDSFALAVIEGRRLFLRAAGSAPNADRFLYFSTAVYAAVEYAVKRNCRELHLGTGSIVAKTSRGAATRELYLDVAA